MNKERIRLVLKIFAAYAFAIAFPIAAKYAFRSNVSIIFIIVLAVIKPTLILIGSFSPKDIRRIFVVVSGIFSVVYVAIITVGIIITPSSAYRILFESIQTNFLSPGRVSNLFVFFIGFFASTFASVFIERDIIGPLAGMMLIIACITAMVFQTPFVYIPLLVFIVVAIVYVSFTTLDKGYGVRSVVFSCIIFALGAGAGFLIYNGLEVQGSKEIDELSNSLRATVSQLFPSIPLMYELPEFGFSFEDEFRKPLGSTPILSEVPILEVDANIGDKLIYVRTRIHSHLSENMTWETPAYDALEKKNKQLEAKGEESLRIEVPDFIRINPALKTENEIAITVLGEYLTMFPNTLDAAYLRVRKDKPTIVYGSMDEGYYLDKNAPLLSGDVVYIGRSRDAVIGPIDMAEYLQVPAFISERIKTFAKTFSIGGTAMNVVEHIKDVLAQKYTYNLDTGDIKQGENFLDKFLFTTKSGYSTHFASALIVLARLNGIPARYATGFLAVIPQPKVGSQTPFFGFKTLLTGLSAHVWPEVWYPGIGWKIVEATPAVVPDFYAKTDSGLVYGKSISLNSYTRRQLKGLLGEAVVEPAKEKPEQPAFSISLDPVIFLYIAIPVILLLFAKRYSYIARYVFAKNRETLNYLGKKIVRKHRRSAVPAPETDGWLKWGEDLKEKTMPHHQERIDEFTNTISRIVYGGADLTKQDVRAVFAFYRKVGAGKKKQTVTKSA